MELLGALALRGNQPVGRYCPIERALAVINTRSAILLLREAFYGASRFEDFAARTGLTEATTAKKLRDLLEAGVLETRPYQRPGERRRDEYVLTEPGTDLLPVVFALLQWGNDHDPPPYPPALSHQGCGEPITIVARCSAGHEVESDQITVSAAGPFGLEEPRSP
jgi:DNA-binding HxlR family transcriptional regulator